MWVNSQTLFQGPPCVWHWAVCRMDSIRHGWSIGHSVRTAQAKGMLTTSPFFCPTCSSCPTMILLFLPSHQDQLFNKVVGQEERPRPDCHPCLQLPSHLPELRHPNFSQSFLIWLKRKLGNYWVLTLALRRLFKNVSSFSPISILPRAVNEGMCVQEIQPKFNHVVD